MQCLSWLSPPSNQDLIIKDIKHFPHIEQLLFKASTGLPFEEHLNFVCDFFDDDFNKAEIAAELRVLKELYFNAIGQEKPRYSYKGCVGPAV